MMKNLNLKVRFICLAAFSLLLIASNQLLAQDLPGDHSRWIGDIEGPIVDERGSANVYEFRFQESGKVKIFRHMPVEKREQTFDFEMVGLDIKLTGDSKAL
jgi:hypothetical protein